MENPFKFGTIVEDNYFTDRVKEVAYIGQFIQSANHLVIISPRRFGKSSVVTKAVRQTYHIEPTESNICIGFVRQTAKGVLQDSPAGTGPSLDYSFPHHTYNLNQPSYRNDGCFFSAGR